MNRLIALSISILFSSVVFAQWERLDAPSPTFGGKLGNITTIAISDSFVWAGTESSGIFRNSAELLQFNPWTIANSGIKGYTIYSLTYFNNSLIATTNAGIYRSDNNGGTWLPINNGLPIGQRITSFVALQNELLASTSSFGVFRSTDNGQNWQAANNGLLDNNVLQLKTSANTVWAVTRNAGLFKSENGGQLWTSVASPDNCIDCQEMAVLDSTILIAKDSLLVSTDNGKNWLFNNSVKNIIGVKEYKGILTAYSKYRLYHSVDSGKNWQIDWEFNVDSSLEISTAFKISAFEGYVGTKQSGVFKGVIAAVTWKPFSEGLVTANVSQMAHVNGTLYAVAYDNLYRSTDNGDTWTVTDDIYGDVVSSFFVDGNTIYVGSDTSGIRVANTSNYLFQDANNGLGSSEIHRIIKRNNTVFALTKGGIYRTPNDGQNWFKFADNIDSLLFTDILFDGNTLYAGTDQGLYKSENGGNSFERVDTNNLQRFYVHFIKKINSELWMKMNVFTHISSDGGVTWPRHFYVGGFTFADELEVLDDKVYTSTNSGFLFKDTAQQNWNFMPRIVGLRANSFAKNNSYLFAGTTAGIWRLPLTNIIASTKGVSSTKEIAIYPNPATHNITISDEMSKVTIYSLQGKELLKCSNCNALNISELPKGIYIVKAQSDKEVFTQKIIKQ